MFVTQAVGSADRLTPLHLPRHQGLLEEDVVVQMVPALRRDRLARNRHCGRCAEEHFSLGDQNRRLHHREFLRIRRQHAPRGSRLVLRPAG